MKQKHSFLLKILLPLFAAAYMLHGASISYAMDATSGTEPVLMEEQASPIVRAIPGLNAAVTYENIMAILNQYDPSSAYILQYTHGIGADVTSWWTDGSSIIDRLDTAVHEETHRFLSQFPYNQQSSYLSPAEFDDFVNNRIYAYYIGNGQSISVKFPRTGNVYSSVAAVSIPSGLRTFRYDTYVGSPDPLMASEQYGVYGILDEFNAYGQGMHVTNCTYNYLYNFDRQSTSNWTTFLTEGGNNLEAYAEFSYFALHYLAYVKDNAPAVYASILGNADFCKAFSTIERNFAKELEIFFAYLKNIEKLTGSTSLSSRLEYWWKDYRMLMTEMAKPRYRQIMLAFNPTFKEPYLSLNGIVCGSPSNNANTGNTGTTVTPISEDKLLLIRSFVERMYTVALGRASDSIGLADWVSQLVNGTKDGASIAIGFICSKEFQQNNYSDEEYVDILYKTFFNRGADTGGKKDWLHRLELGNSREHVLAGFVNSKEFTTLCNAYGINRGTMEAEPELNLDIRAFVLRLYEKALKRDGERDGIGYWTRNIQQKKVSPEDAAKGFFNSAEFRNKNLSDTEYVKRLYETFLDRQPDAPGLATWLYKLKAGNSRESVLEGFSRSVEFKNIMKKFGL